MAVCRMSDIFLHHIPVLFHEVLDQLMTTPDGIYVDATFGRGSHSEGILQRLNAKGRLFAFDKDPESYAYGQQHFSQDKRFKIFHCSYARMSEQLKKENVVGKITGILFDLGVSSPQLDNPDRGFSFTKNGPLDMRMDPTKGMDAATWLNNATAAEIADVLWRYGEERFSRRIAQKIVRTRQEKPLTTTQELVSIIMSVIPTKKKKDKHPATRSFQAIRIAINQELTELEHALNQSVEVLDVGGRLAVISFHSLEDRIVKQFIRLQTLGESVPAKLPIKARSFTARLTAVGKPIKPSLQEINTNPRARSAILRIAEKKS